MIFQEIDQFARSEVKAELLEKMIQTVSVVLKPRNHVHIYFSDGFYFFVSMLQIQKTSFCELISLRESILQKIHIAAEGFYREATKDSGIMIMGLEMHTGLFYDRQQEGRYTEEPFWRDLLPKGKKITLAETLDAWIFETFFKN